MLLHLFLLFLSWWFEFPYAWFLFEPVGSRFFRLSHLSNDTWNKKQNSTWWTEFFLTSCNINCSKFWCDWWHLQGGWNWQGELERDGSGEKKLVSNKIIFFSFLSCCYVELILFLCTRISSFKAKQIVFILFCLWATAIFAVVSQKGKRI